MTKMHVIDGVGLSIVLAAGGGLAAAVRSGGNNERKPDERRQSPKGGLRLDRGLGTRKRDAQEASPEWMAYEGQSQREVRIERRLDPQFCVDDRLLERGAEVEVLVIRDIHGQQAVAVDAEKAGERW